MTMNHSSPHLQKTSDYWSAQGAWEQGRGHFWSELDAVQQRLNRLASGNPSQDWIHYSLDQFFSAQLPLGHCLSLGCGEGGLERRLAELGAFIYCDACDIATGSIARARELAEADGYANIHYSVQDINKIALPSSLYDAVWASGSVHHFENLEHVFNQVHSALKSNGLFILNEYVGPNRFQFTPYQRQVIQACLDLLPSPYRQIAPFIIQAKSHAPNQNGFGWLVRRVLDKWHDGDLLETIGRRLRQLRATQSGGTIEKNTVNLPTVRSVIAVDPSEAVRSVDILPILQRDFDIVESRPLGGTILQFLLADIAGNFERDEVGERLLEMLFNIEDTLIETGHLESDFAYIVATPKQPTT